MASSTMLPPVTTIKSLSTAEQTKILDLLFEPSPEIHSLFVPAIETKEYSSYDQLVDICHEILVSLASMTDAESKKTLHGILGSHPRLGAKKVDSAQSASEQAKLQGSEEESAQLAALNAEYEEKFPGLRYVVFVNGRGRPEIMQNMRERIAKGDIHEEEQEAIQAMCDIAKDRARKLQS